MEVMVIINKFFALQLSERESCLILVEGLLLVELIAVGCSHDVSVQVLFGHEKFSVTYQVILRETGAIVEAVLLVSSQTFLIEANATARRAIAPVALVLCLWALNGSAEVCGQFTMFVVRCGVHQGLFAVSPAESVQMLIILRDSLSIKAS